MYYKNVTDTVCGGVHVNVKGLTKIYATFGGKICVEHLKSDPIH